MQFYIFNKEPKPLKERSRIYTGPTSAANRGSTHLRRTKAELVPQSPRSWPALERGFVPSRADASRGSIENSMNRGFARSRKPRFSSECRGVKQLGRDTQTANPAFIHLCPIAHV